MCVCVYVVLLLLVLPTESSQAIYTYSVFIYTCRNGANTVKQNQKLCTCCLWVSWKWFYTEKNLYKCPIIDGVTVCAQNSSHHLHTYTFFPQHITMSADTSKHTNIHAHTLHIYATILPMHTERIESQPSHRTISSLRFLLRKSIIEQIFFRVKLVG